MIRFVLPLHVYQGHEHQTEVSRTACGQYDRQTARPFETVNGVEAHGGSIDNAGVQVAGRMVYVQSGYSLFGQLPGNVLLASELPDGPTSS